MGEPELKAALQREGEAQIRDFWQQSESVVASRREELETQRVQLRAETDRRLQTEAAELSISLLFEARTHAMGCRLHAEMALEERLRMLAQQMLPMLANADRAALWKSLREELPAAEWTVCKIHSADQQRADRDFPAADIACDETLGGGMIVTTADGMIRIDNSLSCRLLRAWPELLPKLLDELRKQVDNDETAHTDTAG
jgi:vacuolar-type H+-ATPase subunit E/Vma4